MTASLISWQQRVWTSPTGQILQEITGVKLFEYRLSVTLKSVELGQRVERP